MMYNLCKTNVRWLGGTNQLQTRTWRVGNLIGE